MPDPEPAASSDETAPVQPTAAGSVHVLGYRTAEGPAVVRIGSFANLGNARLLASILEGEGIPCALQNVNSNSVITGAVGLVQVHLEVPGACAERAAALLKGLMEDPDAVEPVEEESPTEDAADDGDPLVKQVAVAAFDHPRAMRDAAAVLGSANLGVHLPRLKARGDRPAGTGARFIIRVNEEDADRARSLLDAASREEEEEVDEDDDPRCPKCDAWRVHRHSRQLGNLFRRLSGKASIADEWECLNCGHRWNAR